MTTPEQLTERARTLVRTLTDLTVLDAVTVLTMATACMVVGRRAGSAVETVAEKIKQTIIEQVRRLEDRR